MNAFVVNGSHVYPVTTDPGEGGVFLDAAIAIPIDASVRINGAPVIEQCHEFVQKKTDADA
jgi:hypothetical protein